MPACENLPQELIVAIADNISNDEKSLIAFSLVCKAWTNPAREHLFGWLYIADANGRFEKILAANITSTYTPFLRNLYLTSRPSHSSDKFWHKLIPFLADFKTPRLRHLELENLTWHSLSLVEQSALLRRFESIDSLELCLDQRGTAIDLATIICSFPHLRELTLTPSWYEPGPSHLSCDLHLPKQLSTLRTFYFKKAYRLFLEWLCSIPEQLSIHTFHITMCKPTEGDVDIVNMFLKALGPSLEVFVYESEDGHPSIDLTCNSHLRCINFHFIGYKHKAEDVLFAMSTLSRIGSRQLETAVFRIPYCEDGDFPTTEWIQLDAMLASPQFATLKDVRISARRPCTIDLSTLFATSLPACHARGIISVDPDWSVW